MASRKEQKEAARAAREAAEQAAAAKSARSRRMTMLVGIIAVAAVLVVVGVVVSQGGGGGSKNVKGATEVAARFKGVPQKGLTVGNPNAPVTLVEYGDLKCPVCREFALDVYKPIFNKYVRSGKLKLQFVPQAFVGEQINPGDSRAAASFMIALGNQDKAWNFIDLFYINQKDETERYASTAFLKKLAAAIPGANGAKALAQSTSPQVSKVLDQADSAFTNNGFTGTPSFQIGKSGGTMTTLDASDPSKGITAQDVEDAIEKAQSGQ